MKTGVELISEIASLSAKIAQMRAGNVYHLKDLKAEREKVRKELADLPDTASFC